MNTSPSSPPSSAYVPLPLPATPAASADKAPAPRMATDAEAPAPGGPPSNPIAAATHSDPSRCHARLRAGPALAFDPDISAWIASRAEVVAEALQHPALGVRPEAEPVPHAIADGAAGRVYARMVRMTDGPEQADAKLALGRALDGIDPTTVRAHALEAARLLPPMPLDAWQFAMPLTALAGLIGFDADDRVAVATEGRAFAACVSPLATPDRLRAAHHAADALRQRIAGLQARRSMPSGSLIGTLRPGSGMDAPTLQANLIGLFAQTCDGTAGLIGQSVLALAARAAASAPPNDDDFAGIVRAVALCGAPIQNTRRFVAQPCTIGGVALGRGDTVLLLLASANEEVAHAADATGSLGIGDVPAGPGAVDRWAGSMPGFGLGAHACPGRSWAFALAATGLAALHRSGFIWRDAAPAQRGFHASANARVPRFDPALRVSP